MIKNIIFDVGDVLARPQTGHWFITPNFWNIIDKKFVDGTNLKASLDKYPNVVPEESIYIDDNLDIIKKAQNYNFNLLLMDRYNKHNSNDFISISNLDNLLDTLKMN